MLQPPHKRRQFIDATMDLIGGVLNVRRVAFYLVDDQDHLHDFTMRFVPVGFNRDYQNEMYAFDPLHVSRLRDIRDRAARLADAPTYMEPAEICEYSRFLACYGVEDSIEFTFRDEERIVAGLSVMWTANDPSPTAETFERADQVCRYVQYTAERQLLVRARDPYQQAARVFHLTAREAEVAKLVCLGRTNAEIGLVLGISVATVKTHILRIFEKSCVETRAGLVARISGIG